MKLLKPVVRGMLTYVPPIERRIAKSTRGSSSARYCYSVWLRHLVMAQATGLDTDPRVVAELGPGDSLGMGLAALLTGASRYVALDIVVYADTSRNATVLEELIGLFKSCAPIPDASEFPDVKPYLPSYAFPESLLTEDRLHACLDEARLEAIRAALRGEKNTGVDIDYRAPWTDAGVIEPDTIDMAFSQAVLEHVDDLPETYDALYRWLKPGGFASHEISFVSHKLTPEWNGHWAISRPVWRLIRGRRPYLLNREPASTHTALIGRSGLEIVNAVRVKARSDVDRAHLASPFKGMSEEDLTTTAMFVQAVKSPH